MQKTAILTMLFFCAFSRAAAGEPQPAHDLKGTEPRPAAGHPESFAGAIPAVAAPRAPFDVRLYGLADLDITHAKDSKGITMTTFGIWTGSRLGLKGSADLGHGLKSIFKLESGFGTKDGKLQLMQGGRLFGRQAYFGLESGLGAVTLGRQYPVSDAVAGIADVALPGVLSAYKSQFYWRIDRLDNALLYSSPKMGGFQARLGYAFGKKAGAAGGSTTTSGLLYDDGALTAGVSLESWKTSAFGTSSTVYNFWNLAASYDLGVVTLVAGFSSDDLNLDISSTAAVRSKTYALGAMLPAGTAGKAVFLLQAIKPGNGQAMNIASLRYAHALSKHASLYSKISLANSPAGNAYGLQSEFIFGVHYQFDASLFGN